MPDEVKQEEGKVTKKFEADLSFMTAVLGGGELFKPSKLISDELRQAINELAKEEKERAIKAVKEKTISIIARKTEHDREVAKLKKEFKNKEEESMKKFSQEVDLLKKDLEDIRGIEKKYYDALTSAEKGVSSISDDVDKPISE